MRIFSLRSTAASRRPSATLMPDIWRGSWRWSRVGARNRCAASGSAMPRRTKSSAITDRTRDEAFSFKSGSFKSGRAAARDCIWELSTVGESQRMVCQEEIRLTEEQVHEVRVRVRGRAQVYDAEVWPDGRICPKPKCHSRRSGHLSANYGQPSRRSAASCRTGLEAGKSSRLPGDRPEGIAVDRRQRYLIAGTVQSDSCR